MNPFYKEVLVVIRSTRELSLPKFGVADVLEKKSESAVEVVTEIDRTIEKFLDTSFKDIDSSIEFVGEEFGGNRDQKRYWLVDPIDGTGLYIRGLIGCTTMVALVEDGEVVFGAIYDFVHDDMYYAIRGKGAFKDGERLEVSKRGINNAYVAYETKFDKAENIKMYQSVLPHCKPVKLICAGYEFVLVASGKLEGRISYDPYGKDYDYAPGTLLVAEAGGVVKNIGKESYDFCNPNHIALNSVLYTQLTEGSDALFPITE